MKAHVSDSFDLVLRWEDDVRCEIVWSASSRLGRFDVLAKLWFPPGLDFQGPTRIDFSTACNAHSLSAFADELDDFASGRKASVVYGGSFDMTLTLRERRGMSDCADLTVMVCDLKYEFIRFVDRVACPSPFEVTLGKVEDPKGVAKAIREVIDGLKMKDS